MNNELKLVQPPVVHYWAGRPSKIDALDRTVVRNLESVFSGAPHVNGYRNDHKGIFAVYQKSIDGRVKTLEALHCFPDYPFDVYQEVRTLRNGTMVKTVNIGNSEHVEKLTKDGFYSSSVAKYGVKLREFEVAPVERKFMEGMKGKLQRLALKLGTDSNGRELPLLRDISAKVLELIAHAK